MNEFVETSKFLGLTPGNINSMMQLKLMKDRMTKKDKAEHTVGGIPLSKYNSLPKRQKLYHAHLEASKMDKTEAMSRKEFYSTLKGDKPKSWEAAGVATLFEDGNVPTIDELAAAKAKFNVGKGDKTPTPMSWDQAHREIERTYGKLVGNEWIVTNEDRASNKLAKDIVVHQKKNGEKSPQYAGNYARRAVDSYRKKKAKIDANVKAMTKQQRIDNAERTAKAYEKLRNNFKELIGVDPGAME